MGYIRVAIKVRVRVSGRGILIRVRSVFEC